jgi:hypothetical protein
MLHFIILTWKVWYIYIDMEGLIYRLPKIKIKRI